MQQDIWSLLQEDSKLSLCVITQILIVNCLFLIVIFYVSANWSEDWWYTWCFIYSHSFWSEDVYYLPDPSVANTGNPSNNFWSLLSGKSLKKNALVIDDVSHWWYYSVLMSSDLSFPVSKAHFAPVASGLKESKLERKTHELGVVST